MAIKIHLRLPQISLESRKLRFRTEDPSFYLIISHYNIFPGYTISKNDPYKIYIRNVQRGSVHITPFQRDGGQKTEI